VSPSPPVIKEKLKEEELKVIVPGFRKRWFCLFRLIFPPINCLSHNKTLNFFHKKNYRTLVTITIIRNAHNLKSLFKKKEFK